MGNKSFSFGSVELSNTFKVFAWTVASAFVAMLINALGIIEIPAQYTFAVPMINTLLYGVKEWIADNQMT